MKKWIVLVICFIVPIISWTYDYYNTPQTGQWQYNEYIDPIDDSIEYYVYIVTDWGNYYKPNLNIRFFSDKIQLFIDWDRYIGIGGGYESVTYRIGTNTAVTEDWLRFASGEGTYKMEPEEIIKEMMQNTKMVFRMYLSSEGYMTVEFDISGLYDMLLMYSDKLDGAKKLILAYNDKSEPELAVPIKKELDIKSR